MRRAWPAGALLLASAAAGCSDEAPAAPEPRATAGDAPDAAAAEEAAYHDDGPYVLRDVTAEAGLSGFHQVNGSAEKPFIVETVGGGCALFDADGDGDLDAYLTNGGRLGAELASNPSDALYANDGRGRFADASAAAGIDERRWTSGVRAADVDGDGACDLLLTNYGPETFYAGDGRGAFVERAAGLGDEDWSTGAAFLDFDRDGDLDLYLANYVAFDEARMLGEHPVTVYQGIEVMKGPQGLPGAPDHFFVNEGGLRFHEASRELGIVEDLFGFQCIPFDFDGDGWLDVFVANDSVANALWRNREGKRFEDVALRQGLAFSLAGRPQACMGIAVGDFDGDLLVDLFATNFADDYSTVYRGQARGFFLDVTQAVGLGPLTMAELSWGTGFVDLDLDGDLELYEVNGHVYPQVDRFPLGMEYHQRAQLFEYDGVRWREPDGRGGRALAAKRAGRGSATGDVDGDGDLDLLIEDIDGPPRLLRNEGRTGHGLVVELVGAGANREAVGARLVARVGERKALFLVGTAAGFLSSCDRRVTIGLGAAEALDELEVTWPLGASERFTGLRAGTRVRIEERPGAPAGVTITGP